MQPIERTTVPRNVAAADAEKRVHRLGEVLPEVLARYGIAAERLQRRDGAAPARRVPRVSQRGSVAGPTSPWIVTPPTATC